LERVENRCFSGQVFPDYRQYQEEKGGGRRQLQLHGDNQNFFTVPLGHYCIGLSES
jgi:hypothetical protein